jgi:hypothetical protein
MGRKVRIRQVLGNVTQLNRRREIAGPCGEGRDQGHGAGHVQPQQVKVAVGDVEGIGHAFGDLSGGHDLGFGRPQHQRAAQGGMAAAGIGQRCSQCVQTQLCRGDIQHIGNRGGHNVVGRIVRQVQKRDDRRGGNAGGVFGMRGLGLVIKEVALACGLASVPEHPAKRDGEERDRQRQDRVEVDPADVGKAAKATTDAEQEAHQQDLRQDLGKRRQPGLSGQPFRGGRGPLFRAQDHQPNHKDPGEWRDHAPAEAAEACDQRPDVEQGANALHEAHARQHDPIPFPERHRPCGGPITRFLPARRRRCVPRPNRHWARSPR